MDKTTFDLGSKITLENLHEVAFNYRKVKLPSKAKTNLLKIRKNLLKLIDGDKPIYGINTGFGELANKKIPSSECKKLQLNFVRSHSCGVGKPLNNKQIRAIMFLRAQELSKGHSGVRPQVVETLVNFLNKGVIPYVPSRGSVGASGDLAPLSHVGLCLIGEGKSKINNPKIKTDWTNTKTVLKKLGIKPLVLQEKEGLSLANGTQAMQAVGGLNLINAFKLFHSANLISAMTLESLKATPVAFDAQVHNLKPHYGQVETANFLRNILSGSQIRKSHQKGDARVQDSYSIRCIPQVHGACKQTLDFTTYVLETEMQSVTDNPIVTWDKKYENIKITSAGNFHGQAISMAFDFAGLAMTVLGNISERRTFQMINESKIIPSFLTENSGVESGFMILQYTAASLASENKTLAHPASSDSIPTCANKEDFVSMGMWAAHKFKNITENTARILAIELLAAAKAIEFHKPLKSSKKITEVYKQVRKLVPETKGDKSYADDIELVTDALLSGLFCL